MVAVGSCHSQDCRRHCGCCCWLSHHLCPCNSQPCSSAHHSIGVIQHVEQLLLPGRWPQRLRPLLLLPLLLLRWTRQRRAAGHAAGQLLKERPYSTATCCRCRCSRRGLPPAGHAARAGATHGCACATWHDAPLLVVAAVLYCFNLKLIAAGIQHFNICRQAGRAFV